MIGIVAGWLARNAIGRAVIGALGLMAGVGVALAAVDRSGRRRERDRREIEDLRRAAERRRRMDHADIGHGDVDADREWLRARGRPPASR